MAKFCFEIVDCDEDMQKNCAVFQGGDKCLLKCHYAQCFRKQKKDISSPTMIFKFASNENFDSKKEICMTCQYYYDSIEKLSQKKEG